jgi:hypothetical protein
VQKTPARHADLLIELLFHDDLPFPFMATRPTVRAGAS